MLKNLQIWLAFACVIAGLVLIGVAIAIEPAGEIHYSVLVAYGETLTFAGSLLGVDYHYRYKEK